MTALDRVLPAPRLRELDHVDLAVSPDVAWRAIRHTDLSRHVPIVRALFAIRTFGGATTLKIDDLRSTSEHPGFQVLSDEAHEVVVGAVGKVWRLDIPFVHVADEAAYANFDEPGFVKVAWALRVSPRGERGCRLEVEVRVDATDRGSWRKFAVYFRQIGWGSRFIRHTLLAHFGRELGTLDGIEPNRVLPGDELLPDARNPVTHFIDIEALPSAIWPWLVQMGCRRAGFYSIDALDNGNERSAREVHPDLQDLRVGDVLPATPHDDAGFEVLAIETHRWLILGGLWDPVEKRQLRFEAPRPEHYWHVTWAFVLEPLDEHTTRLHVRGRAAFPETGALHAGWIRPVHALMESVQLRGLKARAEGSLRRDDLRDVLDGIAGAARMSLAMFTPRGHRAHWGLDESTASRHYPGDELVAEPQWGWVHGVDIDASAEDVWPWIAQIGADKGGFYSHQWLENLSGCDLRNAETIHPEWEVRAGGALSLHPKMPPIPVVCVEKNHMFIAHASPVRKNGEPWFECSWLFLVEPTGPKRCRLISRYRANGSRDVRTRIAFGPALLEPIGFEMDRSMLLGVKRRAERSIHHEH